MVEAMVALTLIDALMLQSAQCDLLPNEAAVEDLPNPMGITAVRPGGPREDAHKVSSPVGLRVDEE